MAGNGSYGLPVLCGWGAFASRGFPSLPHGSNEQ